MKICWSVRGAKILCVRGRTGKEPARGRPGTGSIDDDIGGTLWYRFVLRTGTKGPALAPHASVVRAEDLSYRFLTRTGTKAPNEPVPNLLARQSHSTGIDDPIGTGS